MEIEEHEALARELVRALRGDRPQAALSSELGYRSNVIYRWESGRRVPTAGEALRLAAAVGVDVASALAAFDPDVATRAARLYPVGTEEHASALLDALRRDLDVGQLAKRCGTSRAALQRSLLGETRVTLPAMLALVDATTGRLLELVALLTPAAASLPTLRAAARRTEAQRQAILASDVAELVLPALEIEIGTRRARHDARWVAGLIGADHAEVEAVIDQLAASGAISWDGSYYRAGAHRHVATSVDRDEHIRKARAWGARALAAAPPLAGHGYLVASLSDRDVAKVRAVLTDAYERIRRIVEDSSPSERIVVVAHQLAALDGESLPPR